MHCPILDSREEEGEICSVGSVNVLDSEMSERTSFEYFSCLRQVLSIIGQVVPKRHSLKVVSVALDFAMSVGIGLTFEFRQLSCYSRACSVARKPYFFPCTRDPMGKTWLRELSLFFFRLDMIPHKFLSQVFISISCREFLKGDLKLVKCLIKLNIHG